MTRPITYLFQERPGRIIEVVELTKYEELYRALEYYANLENWREYSKECNNIRMNYFGRISNRDNELIQSKGQYQFYAGKRARAALAAVAETLEKE